MIEIVRSGRIGEVINVNSRRYREDKHAVRYPDTDPVLIPKVLLADSWGIPESRRG